MNDDEQQQLLISLATFCNVQFHVEIAFASPLNLSITCQSNFLIEFHISQHQQAKPINISHFTANQSHMRMFSLSRSLTLL